MSSAEDAIIYAHVLTILNHYSFIEYFSNEDAERAVQKLNGRHLGGKQVTVTGIKVVKLIYRDRLALSFNLVILQIYQRSRSRSCSPITDQRDSRQRSSSGNTASTPLAWDLYPDVNTRRHRDSPPPSYAYRHTLAPYNPTHFSPPHYHSAVPLAPIEQETSSLELYNSSTSRYAYGEGEYGYIGTNNRLGSVENWKHGCYDYGHDAGYCTARRFWEERTERQEFDPLRHYQH